MMKAQFIFMPLAESISHRLQALQAVGDLNKQHASQKPDPLFYHRHTGVYR